MTVVAFTRRLSFRTKKGLCTVETIRGSRGFSLRPIPLAALPLLVMSWHVCSDTFVVVVAVQCQSTSQPVVQRDIQLQPERSILVCSGYYVFYKCGSRSWIHHPSGRVDSKMFVLLGKTIHSEDAASWAEVTGGRDAVGDVTLRSVDPSSSCPQRLPSGIARNRGDTSDSSQPYDSTYQIRQIELAALLVVICKKKMNVRRSNFVVYI